MGEPGERGQGDGKGLAQVSAEPRGCSQSALLVWYFLASLMCGCLCYFWSQECCLQDDPLQTLFWRNRGPGEKVFLLLVFANTGETEPIRLVTGEARCYF